MTFVDTTAGTQLFLDANVLVYHLTGHSVLGPPSASSPAC